MESVIDPQQAIEFYQTLIRFFKEDNAVLFTPMTDGTCVTVEIVNAHGQRRKIQAENQAVASCPYEALIGVASH